MPDFTAIDKTSLITIISAAAAFILVLAIGLFLLKNKSRTKIKHQKMRGGKGWQNHRRRWQTIIPSQLRFFLYRHFSKTLTIFFLLTLIGLGKFMEPPSPISSKSNSSNIVCRAPYIIDGDTFDCAGTRIRLAGIDAPEMPDHCRAGRRCTRGDPFAAKNYLKSLASAQIKCRAIEIDHYGRTIARCSAGDIDLSCAMIAAGHAVHRYSHISCP